MARNARYISQDNKVCVLGHWVTEDGQTLGEVAIITATKEMRFSSSTAMSAEGLSGYATPEYLARHAHKFFNR
jgi:hypothetical protein